LKHPTNLGTRSGCDQHKSLRGTRSRIGKSVRGHRCVILSTDVKDDRVRASVKESEYSWREHENRVRSWSITNRGVWKKKQRYSRLFSETLRITNIVCDI